MAAFNGKWSLVASDNAAAFFDAIKASEEYKNKLRQVGEAAKKDSKAYIEEFAVNPAAKTVKRVVLINGEVKKDTGDVAIGVEHNAKSGDGRPAKIKIDLVSDTKMVRTEVGDGYTSTSNIEVAGDELTITMSSGGVVCTEKYKRN